VQGPQAAATLDAWGAEVVKVELPEIGDEARGLPLGPGDFRVPFFVGMNRGKRSVTVDLRKPEGREVFLRLAEWADVIITNFKAGTMEGWGLGYLSAHELRFAPVRDYADVRSDPMVWANDYLVEVNGETVVGTPVKFSDTPARISAAVPKLGQDTEAVLTELGYTRDDITQLRSCGAI
jgi:crotonobetainyl-CoA:carnitine CoA-transferase CaiB-like acyl-CoA transferase